MNGDAVERSDKHQERAELGILQARGHGIDDFLKSFTIKLIYDCEFQSVCIRKIFRSDLYLQLFQKDKKCKKYLTSQRVGSSCRDC